MNEHTTPGRPRLPAPEDRLALPAPEGAAAPAAEDHDDRPAWYRRPRVIVPIVLLLLIVAAALLFGGGGDEADGEDKQAGPPPATVSAARAQQVEWTEQISAVGTVAAVQGVDVTTELAGTVSAIRFASGGRAARGETLVLLDTSTERAQLQALVAQRNQARSAYDRALRLIDRGAIAQADVEMSRAAFENLDAQVDQLRTVIEKKRIDAPFAGDLGIRLVNLGQYLAPGTPVVSLQQIAPIHVNFPVPETTFGRLREGQEVRIRSESYPERTFTGRITAINSEVDESTRNILVQATVANRDRALRPGMFADVTVMLPGSRTVVAVPASAVTTNAYGDQVYAIGRPDPQAQQRERRLAQEKEEAQGGFLSGLFGGGEEKGGTGEQKGAAAGDGRQPDRNQLVAQSQFVETGERRGLLIEVTRGLRAGQRVVTAGQLKLSDGAPVTIAKDDVTDMAPARPKGY